MKRVIFEKQMNNTSPASEMMTLEKL